MKTSFTSYLLKALPLLVLFIAFSCGDKNDPEPQPLIERETSYSIPVSESGEILTNYKRLWTEKVYDEAGLLIKEKYRKLSYSGSGYPIPDNLFTETNTYEGGVLMIKIVERAEPPVTEKYVYTYKDKKLTAKDYYFGYGTDLTLLQKYWYEYATGDQPSKMYFNHYNFSYEPDVFEYTYDSRGNKIKENIISDDYAGHPHSHRKGTFTWEYDEHNNLTKETFYSAQTKTTTITKLTEYKYTPDGKIAEEIRSFGGNFFEKYVYHYNQQGLVEKVEVLKKDGAYYPDYTLSSILEHEYVFRK
ncbi:hypothetical protein H7F15_16980 [Pontibacter sp. Tf4]|uniref:hypothetical protein n=1 Tax=Pontibacter sp. Tf4 TaxID=2761620 RepID=UPI0016286018|nr:hypothetical protein [Pontibacter sp. Tf4]MBB6612739.1 hypothetical protein [Pontibacter sp. Tf4]